jgi:DNA-binding transcriptional regulator YiaG
MGKWTTWNTIRIQEEEKEDDLGFDLTQDPLTPETIREVRKSLRMTRDEFADMLAVTTRTVLAWEKLNRDQESRNCTGAARKLLITFVRHPNTITYT